MMNCTKILLLLILTLGLSSCNEENTIDDYLRNSDAKLCSKSWVEEYRTDTERCLHTLQFGGNGSGKETFHYTRINGGNIRTETFYIKWRWVDADMEGLIIDYGANDISYFDNVWVREHFLSGKLDGHEVTFADENYY